MADEGKLAIENLSYDTSEITLVDTFSSYGEMKECELIMDGARETSRGFGFVTYEDPENAQKAIDGMNGKELDGHQISVRKRGEPREDRSVGNQDRGRGRGRGDGRGRGRGGYNTQPYPTNE